MKLKRIKSIIRLFPIYTLVFITVSCSSDNDIEKACLPEPTGIIMSDKLNVTIYTKVNDKWGQIESLHDVILVYQNQEKRLFLTDRSDGLIPHGTDWQTIPSLDILKVNVKIDGQIYTVEPNIIPINTNKISMIIHETQEGISVEFKDYQKCVDTIDLTD